jgi:hypothetical protein
VANLGPDVLSKSRVLEAQRCSRRAWLLEHEPSAPELRGDEGSRQLRLDRLVTQRAGSYFLNAVTIGEGELEDRLARTQEAVDSGASAILWPVFVHGGVRVEVDVLERRPDGFVLIDVHASASVKDQHPLSAAVQLHVLRQLGIPVVQVDVMHLNSDSVFPDLHNLFTRADITGDVEALLLSVPSMIAATRSAEAATTLPAVTTGDHCHEPAACAFMERCSAGEPAHLVAELYRVRRERKEDLVAQGFRTIFDLPPSEPLSDIADRQRRAVQSGKLIIERQLSSVLDAIQSPIGYLDFETVQLAIPCWPGCSPFQQVPVQFSYDLQDPTGVLQHFEWLAPNGSDPRPPLAAALVHACQGAKTILAYYAPFEKACIKGLIEAVPALADELRDVLDRIVDLLPIVRNGTYHPDFHGSFSIKVVHPVLVGAGDPYAALAVPNGMAAMEVLEKLLFDGTLSEPKRVTMRDDLLRYCATDTRAMIELHGRLTELAADV